MLNLKTKRVDGGQPRNAQASGERDRRERTEPQLVYDGTHSSVPAPATDGSTATG